MGILTFGSLRRIAAAVVMLMAMFPGNGETSAQALHLDEQKVKAGLVYNFLKYTEWNAVALAARKEMVVCLFGNSALNEYLSPMQGRTAQQYAIRLVEKKAGDDVSSCSVAFIHRNEERNLSSLLRLFDGKEVLTVSDIGKFAERGGMVELSMRQDRRVHIYINRPALAASNLTIPARLLNLSESADAR